MTETDQQKKELDQKNETPYIRGKEETPGKTVKKRKRIKRLSGHGRKSFWKAAVNGILLLLDGFVLALIVCLFLAQPKYGEQEKATIQKFSVNSDQYYSENQTYEQVNVNVHVYESEGRPD